MKAAEFFKKGGDAFKKYRVALAIAPLMLVFATIGNMYSVRASSTSAAFETEELTLTCLLYRGELDGKKESGFGACFDVASANSNWAQPQELDELSLYIDSLYTAILVVELLAAGLGAAEKYTDKIQKTRAVPTLLGIGSGLGLAFFHYVVDAVNHHTAESAHTINHSPTIGAGAYVVIVAPLIAQAARLTQRRPATAPTKASFKEEDEEIELKRFF